MHTNNNEILKTLSPESARLVSTLYSYNRPIFHFKEAAKILGGRIPPANALYQLIHKGIITRLKSGTFRLVPFELGFEREYLTNPCVISRELITSGHGDKTKYYHVSWFSLRSS